MRTTISINDALLKEVRRRAGATGQPFRKALEEVISLGLASSKQTRAKRRIRIRSRAIGLKSVYGKMSLNQLYDQIEAERGAMKSRG